MATSFGYGSGQGALDLYYLQDGVSQHPSLIRYDHPTRTLHLHGAPATDTRLNVHAPLGTTVDGPLTVTGATNMSRVVARVDLRGPGSFADTRVTGDQSGPTAPVRLLVGDAEAGSRVPAGSLDRQRMAFDVDKLFDFGASGPPPGWVAPTRARFVIRGLIYDQAADAAADAAAGKERAVLVAQRFIGSVAPQWADLGALPATQGDASPGPAVFECITPQGRPGFYSTAVSPWFALPSSPASGWGLGLRLNGVRNEAGAYVSATRTFRCGSVTVEFSA